jgi:hypothetical protein
MAITTSLDRAEALTRKAEDHLARVGTLGVVAAGLMALLVLVL